MTSEDYKYMINKYFDGELDKSKEGVLFTFLAQDEECREYFKSMNLIKSSVEQTNEEFPNELEERILYSVENIAEKRNPFFLSKNLFAVVTYSFAVILIVLSIIFYNESRDYKEKFETTIRQVNQQNQMIQLLLNNLPVATVTTSYENEVIVTPKL